MTNHEQDRTPTDPTTAHRDADQTAGGPPTRETLGAPAPRPTTGAERDPEDWVTGDQPMTAAQKTYLDALATEAGEELSADLTKAQASEHIDRLQQVTGRPPQRG